MPYFTVRWPRIAYGFLLLFGATTALPAQTLMTLHSFDSANGANPYARLIQATDGKLYGTTYYGGNPQCLFFTSSCGMVFKMTPDGRFTILHRFVSSEGANPYAGLVQATNGDFYGTTFYGGSGFGTVFKITPGGTLTTLQSFSLGSSDGTQPAAGLLQASDGDLYGTTLLGGATGWGTVFKITPTGTTTALYTFCSQGHYPNCTDGADAYLGPLVQANNGDLYGTTVNGGVNSVGYEGGTVFKITPTGTLTTLYSFCALSGCADGFGPHAGLIQATDGDLYGTTSGNNKGTVFKITPGGTLTTLYSFCAQSGCTDGSNPYGVLVEGTDGEFYGTTQFGGTTNHGTIFKITPSGTLTTLYNFCAQSACTDGSVPWAGLIQDTNGSFYGTTSFGGASNVGTIFSLSVGLGPFIRTLPTSGKVGASIKILGTDLTGTTSVTFNGTAAMFTVLRASEITTTVPAGATTGEIQVMTPTGTLVSNVNFRVT